MTNPQMKELIYDILFAIDRDVGTSLVKHILEDDMDRCLHNDLYLIINGHTRNL